jgi:hypothetical protein
MPTNTWAGAGAGTVTDWNTADNWSEGTVPDGDDDVVIADVSNDPIMGDGLNPTINSLHIESGGHFTAGNNTITIDGRDGSGYSFKNHGTFIKGTSTINITQSAASADYIRVSTAGTRAFHNLTINKSSGTTYIDRSNNNVSDEALQIDGNLTITSGAFDTAADSGSATHYDLTVTGATIVGDGSSGANTATLTCNPSTVSLGASYTAGYGLWVKRGGTFVGGSGAHTFGSFVNDDHAHSITTFTSHASGTTISSENSGAGSNGYAMTIYDDGVFDEADGLVVFTGPSSDVYISGYSLHNVTVNSSGNTIALQNGQTFSGNLTITAGTLTTRPAGTSENNALTVTGDVSLGGTLTGNASAIEMGSLAIAGGTYSATSGTTTMKGNVRAAAAAITHNNGLFKWVTSGHAKTNGNANSTTGFYDIEVDGSGITVSPNEWHLTIYRNLTITQGTFDTKDYAGRDPPWNLTVTGDVSVTGTLTGNVSAIAADSVTIESAGTFTHNGVLTIDGISSGNYAFENKGTWTPATSQRTTFTGGSGTFHVKSNDWNAVTIVANNSANYFFRPKTGTTITWTAYITVTTGSMFQNNNGDSWVVEGNVLVSDDYLGLSTATGDLTFASLTIASGGTYNATSGTTTITNRNSNAKYWENGGGTFTHNNGTVKFTDNDHTGVVENTFYNMHIASANANHYAVVWTDVSGGALKVLNNLIIESGDFELGTAGDTLEVYGKTIIDNSLAGGTPNNTYARFNNDKNQTGTITHHGLVEIISGTYHVEDGGTVNMAGIRNVGGLVD